MGMLFLRRSLGALTCLALAGSLVQAGSVDLEWDPVPEASGYRVYYGLVSGQYTKVKDVGNGTTTTMDSLTDCTDYFMAVKAYNAYGESVEFSNEVFGWARPTVSGNAPAVMQGQQLTVELNGANFKPGALVEVDNPHVALTSVAVPTCNRIQFLATVDPLAPGLRAAEVGSFEVTVQNPSDVFGKKSNAFTVTINPARFDVNKSDPKTRDRLDGKDTVWLSRTFGAQAGDPLYAPDHDFTGDGWIDGDDLAHLAANLGRCWSGSAWGTCGNGSGN
jgi:hypothetical protein